MQNSEMYLSMKKFNDIEKETEKIDRLLMDRQIRLVYRLPKKEKSTELTFPSLRACLTMM